MLFEESVAAAEEITEALGAQVRRAVELLIQSFSESAAEARRRGQPDPLPADTHQIYEAAVTIMMRMVFLLFAEERGLLPSGELFEQGYGISRELDRLQARETEESEEALDATSLTWHRLLATSQALYRRRLVREHADARLRRLAVRPRPIPVPHRHHRSRQLALTVSDRVMLHVLRSVQQAMLKAARRDESRSATSTSNRSATSTKACSATPPSRSTRPTSGCIGTTGEEPEIPLATLEAPSRAKSDPK